METITKVERQKKDSETKEKLDFLQRLNQHVKYLNNLNNLKELCKKRNPFLEVQMAQKDWVSTNHWKQSTSCS